MTVELIRLRTSRGELLPLRALRDGRRWVVVASSPGARWASDLLTSGGGEVVPAGGPPVLCAATPITQPERILPVVEAFRDALGPARWLRRLPARPRVIELQPAPEVRPRGPEERLRLEFDIAATDYAGRVSARPVEVYQKSTTRNRLRARFSGVDPLLEIGPGTGFETLFLLREGHRITAVDVSDRMLEALRSGARSLGLADRLETRVGTLGRLEEALGAAEPGTFAGAYSTFGPFNLEGDLSGVRGSLARCLRPGAALVFTSLNRPAYIPVLWELARGRVTEARARRSLPSRTTATVYPLELYRRRPSEWDALLRPEFERVCAEAVSVLSPPFEGTRSVGLLGPTGRAVARRVDHWLSRRLLFQEPSESVLLTYQRR